MSTHMGGKMVSTLVFGSFLAAAGAAFAVAPAAAPTPTPGASAPQSLSFEELVKQSVPAPTADALVAPFAEDCERSRREIDRARCRGTQAFLRAKLPGKLLHSVVDSTRVVSVSAFDASVRGFKVRVLGCLTCDEPAEGPGGEDH